MIGIVDYDTGNVGSVLNMLKKVGAQAVVSRDHEVLRSATKLVLPGVGAFDEAMGNLHRFGLVDLLNELVIEQRRPLLGVCLGAQLVGRASEEGVQPGLGWINARMVRFRGTEGQTLRVPHMGWNTVQAEAEGGGIFRDVPQPMRFYFVHSYHMVVDEAGLELASSHYGHRFTSAMARDNIVSLQFHPEKSHKYGLQVYRNFVERFETC
ncbi:imidazole glycerol phosphate synthase subunit HisH [Ramlibacter pallidus]|uniref:Imidazole glycerol phosphate synthase subunit HisH n=1 Tax=Ramlibacter pallidus TaxID=2780087 RepID=A0ABR9RYE4_9BURK|nr:imidazole glycerol phosphate synthase subunit HisH [Ramlibacter pallidus]